MRWRWRRRQAVRARRHVHVGRQGRHHPREQRAAARGRARDEGRAGGARRIPPAKRPRAKPPASPRCAPCASASTSFRRKWSTRARRLPPPYAAAPAMAFAPPAAPAPTVVVTVINQPRRSPKSATLGVRFTFGGCGARLLPRLHVLRAAVPARIPQAASRKWATHASAPELGRFRRRSFLIPTTHVIGGRRARLRSCDTMTNHVSSLLRIPAVARHSLGTRARRARGRRATRDAHVAGRHAARRAAIAKSSIACGRGEIRWPSTNRGMR